MKDCERYTAEGIEKANNCGDAFKSILGSITTLNAMAEEISSLVKDQQQQASEIGLNINNIASVAEQTEVGTLHTAQSSEQTKHNGSGAE